jgi:RNA polymerase sigma factor (sigma-70 family)
MNEAEENQDENPAAFERLLAALDPNRDRAVEIYESLRRRCCTFFRFRGFPNREDLFDKTIRIAAQRLPKVEVENIQAWVTGIARNVCRDEGRRGHKEVPLDDISAFAQPPGPDAEAEAQIDRALECMNRCMADLDPEDRGLLVEFYKYSKGKGIAVRAAMARALEISTGNLRVRAFRIRKRLETCVTRCLTETNQDSSHS